jgi:hypothetical protein
MRKQSSSSSVWWTVVRLLVDAVRFVSLGLRSPSHLAAENLFLRKQLALYGERRVKARRADDATRITLVLLSQLIDWRAMLTIVKPDTLIRRTPLRVAWETMWTRLAMALAVGRWTSPLKTNTRELEECSGRHPFFTDAGRQLCCLEHVASQLSAYAGRDWKRHAV